MDASEKSPAGFLPMIPAQFQNLPIYAVRDELIELVRKNPVVVVKGETGSGKSTQIPKYLVAAGFAQQRKCVAITQPRRVAAKSLAERVARETNTEMGKLVGYAVRFVKYVSSETIIKYVTDGLLIKEATTDPNLNQYSVVIIDEAHERSIHTDLCCGLLKRICKSRPDFRVIISSATLEETTFSTYFNNAPVFTITGRAFPVEIVYEPKSMLTYVDGVCNVVVKICQAENQGDILVFLCGMDDIDAVEARLKTRLPFVEGCLKPHILQCHASLSFADQQKVFERTAPGYRKIILATNIAETTLTIENMDFVVDCGYFKQNRFDPGTRIDSLLKIRITKFQAIQRAGRAGRTRPGKCYRLYSESELNSFAPSPIPEVQRCNIEYVILDIISMGFENPLTFEYMTPPSANTIKSAMEYLQELDAIDETGKITREGQIMAKFPVEPQLAKVLVTSVKSGCAPEVMKIAAVLCTPYMNIFVREQSGRNCRHPSILQFTQGSDGDHVTLLKVYNGWQASGYSEQWCMENRIEFRFLEEAKDILDQLKEILTGSGLNVGNALGETGLYIPAGKKYAILKTFVKGYFSRIARKRRDHLHAYEIIGSDSGDYDTNVFLHPSGVLFNCKPAPELIIYHERLQTSKVFLKGTSKIERGMLNI